MIRRDKLENGSMHTNTAGGVQAACPYSGWVPHLPQANLGASATASTEDLPGWHLLVQSQACPKRVERTINAAHLTGCSTAGMVCLRLAWIAQTREAAILHLQDAAVHFRDTLDLLQRSAGPAQVESLQSAPTDGGALGIQ